MNQLFRTGAAAQGVSSGQTYEVREFLGGGGQGEVYRVRGNHHDMALKWYYRETATQEQADKLAAIAGMAPPSPFFLWPQEIATSSDADGFGYVMELRPAQYRSLVALMNGKLDPSFHALCTACMELANSMHLLHARGLCYQDVNWGNVFLRPDNGEILICDNDNVCVNGRAATVLGAPRFMAPEIVRGEATPNADTDRFSLAVLMFMMLLRAHPLDGKRESQIHCLDLHAMKKLYGDEPLFIFHPTDRSNAAVPGLHDGALAFWPIYPHAIRVLFGQTFTDGIADPANGRVRENQWRHALSNARDSIFRCPACRRENFFDSTATAGARSCWSCKSTLAAPLRLDIKGLCQVALNHDTRLYPHHLEGLSRRYDFSRPLAEISQHPQNPNTWGLRNLGQAEWVARTEQGTEVRVPPGRSAVMKNGLHIDFGNGATGCVIWE